MSSGPNEWFDAFGKLHSLLTEGITGNECRSSSQFDLGDGGRIFASGFCLVNHLVAVTRYFVKVVESAQKVASSPRIS